MNNDNYWEQFSTNVGLITSRGEQGDDIMAAAWTYQISYEPGLIAVCIGPGKLTVKNIEKSGEFGVHLASVGQNVVASIAGGSSGNKVNKIGVLKELGCEFFEGKKIKVLMLKDSALAVECKLKEKHIFGDHIMFVGEVVYVHEQEAEPLVYGAEKYFRIGGKVEKPGKQELEILDRLVKKHARKSDFHKD